MSTMLRLFSIKHQTVTLDFDFKNQIAKGVTEILVEPQTDQLRYIHLNNENPTICAVTVNGVNSKFINSKNFSPEEGMDRLTCRYDLVKTTELEIEIPEQIIIDPVDSSANAEAQQQNKSSTFRLLTVKIWFHVSCFDSGLIYVDNANTVNPTPVVYTESDIRPGLSRKWLPCIDRISDRMTWDLRYIVPKRLPSTYSNTMVAKMFETIVVSSGELVGQAQHPLDPDKKIYNYLLTVATPACALIFIIGGFTSCIRLNDNFASLSANNEDENSLNSNSSNNRNSDSEAEVERGSGLSDDDNSIDELFGDDIESKKESKLKESLNKSKNSAFKARKGAIEAIGGVFAFGSMEFEEEILETTSFFCDALAFHSLNSGSYPFTMYKIVFFDGLKVPFTSGASITLASLELLYPKNAIEPVYRSRKILSLAISQQWFGVYVVPEKWSDRWLIIGLASFASSMYLKKNLGSSEYFFRLKKDLKRLCLADVNQKPVSYIDQPCILDTSEYKFLYLKSPIILYMLDKRMIKRGASLGLMRVIPRLLVLAMGNEIGSSNSNSLSTSFFLRLCKKVSGVDLKDFADQWIFGTGCPIFKFSYAFNRKKLVVELTMIQESSNSFATAPYSRKQTFTGQMTARVREADGTPYEHVLDISSNQQKFEVQFNTKYKRIRRNTKRFHLRQMAAAAEEISANAELMGNTGANDEDEDVYSNIALFGAENEEDKRNWRVVEWGEDDEESLASSTFEWLRMDSDMEWACLIYFEQPDFMWAAQLQKDRDVVAQMEAVEALELLPSSAASTTLMRTIMDSRVYYRVRAEAALALSKFATEELGWIGLYHLVKIYKNKFCMQPQGGTSNNQGYGDDEEIDVPRIPKQNNFNNFSEYFTQKAIISSLSNITNQNGAIPISVKNILYNSLKYNDNGENMYMDSYYLSNIITALGNIVSRSLAISIASRDENQTSLAYSECKEAILEIERLRRLDALVPSYNNVITVSALNALHKISLIADKPGIIDPALVISNSLPKNFLEVRISSTSLLTSYFGPDNPDAIKYLFIIAVTDSNPVVCQNTAYFLLQLFSFMIMKFESQLNSDPSTIETKQKDLSLIRFGKSNRKNYDVELENVCFLDSSEKKFPARNLISAFETFLVSIGLQSDLETLLDYSLSNLNLEIGNRQVLMKLQDILFIKPKLIEEKSTMLPQNSASVSSNVPKKLKIRVTGKSSRSRASNREHGNSPQNSISVSGIQYNDFDTHSQKSVDRFTEASPTGNIKFFGKSDKKLHGVGSSKRHTGFRNSSSNMPNIKLVIKRSQNSQAQAANDSDEDFMSNVSLASLAKLATNKSRPRHKRNSSDIKLASLLNLDSYSPSLALKKQITTTDMRRASDMAYASSHDFENTPLSSMLYKTPKILKIKLKSAHLTHLKDSNTLPALALGNSKWASSSETKKMKKIMKKLANHRSAGPFLRPVDPVLDGCPQYFDVIKRPIDLSTIQKKIENHEYSSFSLFESDIGLMLSNCFEFNPLGTLVHNMGLDLQKLFKKLIADLDKSDIGTKKPLAETIYPVEKDISKLPKISIVIENNDTKDTIQKIDNQPKPLVDSFHKKHTVVVETPQNQRYVVKKIKLFSSSKKSSNVTKKSDTEEDLDLENVAAYSNLQEKIASKAPKSIPKTPMLAEMSQTETKALMRILRKLQAHPSGLEFLHPVDPVKQQVPMYFETIKRPMDLGTVETRLSSGQYSTKEMFFDDINLVVKNCQLFNPEGTFVFEQSKILFGLFQSLWKKEMEVAGFHTPSLPSVFIANSASSTKNGFGGSNFTPTTYYNAQGIETPLKTHTIAKFSKTERTKTTEKPAFEPPQPISKNASNANQYEKQTGKARGYLALNIDEPTRKKCRHMLSKLARKQHASPFLAPVDPVALGIPTYFDIVKHPMDLQTIKINLNNVSYYSQVSDFISDLQLVFDNCFLFNPKDSWVYDWGKKMEAQFHELVKIEGWDSLL